MKNPMAIGLAIFSVAFVGLILWLSVSASTPREISLSSVLLTLISIVATWVVAHLYAKHTRKSEIENLNESHEKSLKTYALKAAEKVTNLSNELDRLRDYLSEYMEGEDEDDLDTVLRVRDERITGAVHIVRMLRSVNDGALSDWGGVIGEELSEIRQKEAEKEEERERQMNEMLEKIDELIDKSNSSSVDNIDEQNTLKIEVRGIRKELNQLLWGLPALYGNRALHSRSRIPTKRWATSPCPVCDGDVKVRYTRKGVLRIGGVECSNCDTRFVCRRDEKGDPTLELRKIVAETILCPSCESPFEVHLDNVPGAYVDQECGNCSTTVRVSRTSSGIGIKIPAQRTKILSQPKSNPLDPSFIDDVKEALPEQPWPKGIHKVIATQMDATGSRVHKAIQELIKSGVYKHQIDGVVVEDSPADVGVDDN